MSLPPLSLLPMPLLPRLRTVLMKVSFRFSHTALLWFRVMVMLRFLSTFPVSWRVRLMPLSCMIDSDLLRLLLQEGPRQRWSTRH
jgi:hypothetical protein